MKLLLHPEAEAEMAEAIAFYDRRTAGLGDDFLGEALEAFERIESAPEAWPCIEGPVRRCLVERFPYAVYYRIDPDRIFVLSVTHTRRRPVAWRTRV